MTFADTVTLCYRRLMREDLVVTKANALVEASFRLNVSEQRVLALLCAQVGPDDEDFKPYRFKASELQALIESHNKDEHARLKELAAGLMEKTLRIQRPRGGWLMVNWVSSAEYLPGTGTVELCFDPKLKPYMLRLKERFTTYKLRNVVKLRSRYSVRLYELLKEFEGIGKRSFELADMRKALGLVDAEFNRWQDFRRKVLDVAKRELPKKTDLGFSYTARKQGRAVAFIDFKIWSTQSRDVPSKKLKALSLEAQKCWAEIRGSCAAKWSQYESNPGHVCHWCQKFEKQHLEAQGQARLPGT